MRLTKIRHSLLLALGFAPFISIADAADAGSAREALRDTGRDRYNAQATLGALYGNEGSSSGEADFWVPVWQRPGKVGFLDVRGIKGENKIWEGNVGGGYRLLSDSQQYVYGVYGFYDKRNSDLNNEFQQLTVGGELKTTQWSVTGNYYLPVGTTKYRNTGADNLSWERAGAYENLMINKGYEYGLGGVDAEYGHVIPKVTGLTGYAGYFYFNAAGLSKAVQGPRLRAEYRLDEAFNINQKWLDRLTAEVSWQTDSVRDSVWQVGLRLTVPLGKQNKHTGIESRMNDYVRRDVAVVTAAEDSATPYSVNGMAVKFARVSNATDFVDAAGTSSAADVVVLLNDVTLPNTLELGNNLQITGKLFEYEPGVFINMTDRDVASTITAATNKDAIMVGHNNTLRDLNVTVTAANGSGELYNAILNDQVTSVGTLNIDNIVTNGAFLFQVEDGSSDSLIAIRNNIISASGVTSQSRSSVYTSAIYISGSDSTVNVPYITGNQITLNGKMGIFLEHSTTGSDTMAVGQISGNRISMGAGDSNYSVSVYSKSGTQTVSSINDNTISMGAGDENYGVSVINSGETQAVSSINDNTITMAAGDKNYSVFVNNAGGTQAVSSIDRNRVSLGAGDQNYGVSVLSLSGTQTVSSIDSNRVNLGAGDQNYGVSVSNRSGAQTVSSMDDNTISLGVGQDNRGVGLNNNGTTQTQGSMNDNTISVGAGDGNYGVYVYNNVGTQTVTSMNGNQEISVGLGDHNIGVYVYNNGETQTVGSMDDNEEDRLGAGGDNHGVYFYNNAGTQTVTSMNDNIIRLGAGDDNRGVYFNNFGGTQTVSSIDSNTVSLGAGNSTIGILFGSYSFSNANNDSLITINNLKNNVFKFDSGLSDPSMLYFELYGASASYKARIVVNGLTGNHLVAGSAAANITFSEAEAGNLITININGTSGQVTNTQALMDANGGVEVDDTGMADPTDLVIRE